MSTKTRRDRNAPIVSVEIMIENALEDYDLAEVEAAAPRDVDPMLASLGFKDLLDDARAILDRELSGRGLRIVQLTGAICHDHNFHRPGIWLVVEEEGVSGRQMSQEGQAGVAAAVDSVRSSLGLL